jgi:GrpB-like predicted nucleotidyltransferase (UPF0157 family)
MPRPVVLSPHDPQWAPRAEALIAELRAAAPGVLGAVHHVGSTAVAGLQAKPVIDLLGEAANLSEMEAARPALEALGYRWRGENGVAGRLYFTRDDPGTGARAVHLHVHARDDPAVARHLAFRDRLRADPALAEAYLAEKRRCAALHPGDSGAYTACKEGWIAGVVGD